MHVIAQVIKIVIVIAPAIVPNIAFYFQLKKGNPFCWFWLAGGMIMFAGLALTLNRYGLEKLQNL